MRPISRSTGITETERILARLCDKSFLELWSYPSLWTPEGRKNGKGDGKELADTLIVFGTDIILFSDKDIRFNDDISVQIAWNRWYKKSIDASKGQLFGARKWLLEHPSEVYFDAGCTTRFPFIDPKLSYRIHLIAVTKNAAGPAARYFGRKSTGSLPFYSFDNGVDLPSNLFTIRDDRTKPFVHVFDENTLELVLTELDTAPDFVKYLRNKENAIRNGAYRVILGEEDLLAHYMLLNGPLVDDPFENMWKENPSADFLQIEEGTWDRYVEFGEREAYKQRYKNSYAWDELISIFTQAILTASVPKEFWSPVDQHELAVRRLASEPRYIRGLLAQSFYQKISSTPRNVRSSRIMQSAADPRACIIVVLCPRDQAETYEEYRQKRLNLLYAYSYVAKLKMPSHNAFTLIGTEPGIGERRSEELLAMHIDELTKEEMAEARRLMLEEGILSDSVKKSWNSSVTNTPRPSYVVGIKIGRNEPCKCGSGRKYKRCCLQS